MTKHSTDMFQVEILQHRRVGKSHRLAGTIPCQPWLGSSFKTLGYLWIELIDFHRKLWQLSTIRTISSWPILKKKNFNDGLGDWF